MSKYEILWVADEDNRRDYRDRQLYANSKDAVGYIEGHYNASAYDKPGVQDNPASCLVASNSGSKTREMAKYFADKVSEAFDYPNRGCVVTENGDAGYWNLYYAAGNSILLEPLYVSDSDQALMAQSELGQDKIAQIIADLVRKFYPDGGLIAFSVGHKFKVSSPYDRGAPVVNTDGLGEADLVELYMHKAAALLEAGEVTEPVAPPVTPPTETEDCGRLGDRITLVGDWTLLQGTAGKTHLVRTG
jgi:hypothetical protein